MRITILFILGIIFQYWMNIDGYLVLTSWMVFFILLLFTLIERKGKKMGFHALIGGFIYTLFFVSGMLSYSGSQPDFYKRHYSRHLITGDLLSIQIKETTLGPKTTKAIGEVVGIGYKNLFKKTDGDILLFLETQHELQPGHLIITGKKPNAIQNKNNPGEFDAQYFWKTKGISDQLYLKEVDFDIIDYSGSVGSIFDYSRNYLKSQLQKQLPAEIADLALALSLGDKSQLSSSTRASFASAGAMHVLAVSGLHVGILLAMFQWVFFRIPWFRNRNKYIIFALIGIWFFALLTGLAPSVFRATLMFSILGFGQLLGRRFFNFNALLISALILLMIDGKALFDIGFQLSYLAMLGILFFFQPVRNLFTPSHKWVNYIWEGVAVGIAAQIGTLPVSLYYFHQFPNYFILTNIGMLFLAGIALGSVLIFFVLHAVPLLNILAAEIITYIYKIMIIFIEFIEKLPGSVSKGFSITFFEMLLIYILIALSFYFTQRGKIKLWYSVTLPLLILAIIVNVRRIANDYRSEFIVFNDQHPILLVRQVGENYFFYPDEMEKAEKSVLFLSQGYAQKFGGENHYQALKTGDGVDFVEEVNPEISVFRSRTALELDLGKSGYYQIPLAAGTFSENGTLITGKWLPKGMQDIGVVTTNGAFIEKL